MRALRYGVAEHGSVAGVSEDAPAQFVLDVIRERLNLMAVESAVGRSWS